MGARADDGLDGADFVPPHLSVYLALGTRLGFYRKLRSHSPRNMAHVDRKRTRTHRKVSRAQQMHALPSNFFDLDGTCEHSTTTCEDQQNKTF